MAKMKSIEIQGKGISLLSKDKEDFISLTDIAKLSSKEPRFIIRNWLSTKNTINYLGAWEELHNNHFNRAGFLTVRERFFNNSFSLSPKYWKEETSAIGIISKSGRYGGTYAHKDIAINFCYWLNPVFQIYLIKEFQRLKEIEFNQYNLEWNVKRILTKTNYLFQTEAVQKYILPQKNIGKDLEWLIYAEEADLLNVALFGCTAKEWREANSKLVKEKMNIRDIASINELAVLSNLESLNSEMIKDKLSKEDRFKKLLKVAKYQIEVLHNKDSFKSLKRESDETYLDKK